jgi:hypothetical protein
MIIFYLCYDDDDLLLLLSYTVIYLYTYHIRLSLPVRSLILYFYFILLPICFVDPGAKLESRLPALDRGVEGGSELRTTHKIVHHHGGLELELQATAAHPVRA